jgi:hypothetical protein
LSDPLHDIAMAATELKLGMPNEFERLVEAFKRLDHRCKADLYAADASGIMAAQGRAVVVRNIRTKLETCLQIRSQSEKRK